jgi:hypothetical protein
MLRVTVGDALDTLFSNELQVRGDVLDDHGLARFG